jgi:hypothetical protein
MKGSRYHLLTLMLLAPILTGCHSWHTVTLSPQQLVEVDRPADMRVSQADGTRTHLRDPRVEGDFIVAEVRGRRDAPGKASGRTRSVRYTETVRIALDDIVAVEERRVSVLRTAAVSITGLVVAAAILFIYCIESECISN